MPQAELDTLLSLLLAPFINLEQRREYAALKVSAPLSPPLTWSCLMYQVLF